MSRWATKPLGEFAEVIRGVSFDKSQVFDAPGQKLVPILRAGNIQDSLLTDSDLVYVLPDLVSQQQRMRRGDLAVCMSSGSPAIVGKSAHLEADWDGSVGAFCAIVRFSEKLHHRFGSYWFRSPAFMQWRDNNAKGANIQNLRRAELEKLLIPVPPLEEQERLVKLLDEADELRKLRAQANRRTSSLIPSLFHEMFGDVDSNNKKWPMVRFAEIGDARLGKMLDAKRQTGKHKRLYLRNANVQWNRLDLGDLLEMDFSEADREEFRLRPGDLLICEGGEVGRAAIWRDELPECYFQKALHRVRLHPSKAIPEFVLHLLQAIAAANGFRDYVGSATISHLTGVKLASIRIPLPPLPLQKEFATRVSDIRAVQSEQSASSRRLENLFQSMLHRAFQGEL
jgi:type I restriction enzyme S subunit